jgi:hypothetical protein
VQSGGAATRTHLEEASELGGSVGDVALVLGERDDDVAEGEEALVDVRRLLELLAPHAAPLHALAAREVDEVQLRIDALRLTLILASPCLLAPIHIPDPRRISCTRRNARFTRACRMRRRRVSYVYDVYMLST